MPVVGGDAEHLGDRDQRQLGGHRGDELDLAVDHRLVDEAVGHFDVVVGEQLDRPRGEPTVDEAAHPRVVGRVHVDHHVGQLHVGAVGLISIAPSPDENVCHWRLIVTMSACRVTRPVPVDLALVDTLVTEHRMLRTQSVEPLVRRAVEVQVVALDVEVALDLEVRGHELPLHWRVHVE